MNNIFLLGEIIDISDISFEYTNKLKIYCEFKVKAYSDAKIDCNDKANISNAFTDEQIFSCVLVDDIFDRFYIKLKIGDMVYIIGSATNKSGYLNIIVKDVVFL